MSKNESRQERRSQQNRRRAKKESTKGISNLYYWIIGILFAILILLVIFIFSRSGDDVNLEGEQEQTALIQEESTGENTQEESTSAEETGSEPEENTEETEQPAEEPEEVEEEAESTNSEEGESEVVNENPPHDPNHATDYSTGSSDRVEIKERVMAVTGLESDLIEHWVGNNGPGRVVATVSNREQTEFYEVYLQYGDGNWHVTNYEQVSGN